MGDDVAEVLAAAFVGVCRSCYLPEATDEQWETMKPGEGEGLCWDSPACIQGGDLPAFIAATVAPLLATARAQGAEQERADWSAWLDGWISAKGPMPPTVEAIAGTLRAGPRPFGRADRLAADHTPPSLRDTMGERRRR